VLKIGPQHDPATPSWRPVRPVDMVVPKGYRNLLIASVVVMLGSLLIFAGTVVAGFAYFTSGGSPLWLTVIGVAGILGIGLGFAGLFLVLILAGIKARKNEKTPAVPAE
jgi:hypothetical protein